MKKSFIIPIILFLIFVFIIYFLLPKYSDFKSLKKDISQKQEEINKKENELLNLQKILEELDLEKESFAKIDSALPQDFSIASLLAFFQLKSEENGLVLKSFSESGLLKTKGEKEQIVQNRIKEHYFDVTLVGNFTAFDNFVQSIEQSSRMIEIENISFKRSKELLEIAFLVKIYSY